MDTCGCAAVILTRCSGSWRRPLLAAPLTTPWGQELIDAGIRKDDPRLANVIGQSVSKPFTYALVHDDIGPDDLHTYVGQEPSGRLFNDISLDHNKKPHNPLINAGAIVVASLMKRNASLSDRFDFVFPPDAHLQDTLDLYFQLCSIETNCDTMAVMAATLANGGVNPMNGERIINNRACRDTLSLMYSCGMYDWSGQFAFRGVSAASRVMPGKDPGNKVR
ncbi:glutaminase [Teladorsagia circumcincta]|uniref:glutaminase n=1 Tax=Teladorsagia circumcincta TaxID=45464 RepID=A0A2G9UFK7_TELCI|nr:glutaminase [Teladorsagia circumcincta]